MKKREKIYIIPTEYGLMYGGGIFASLIGGAVYNNNLAFMLCFFLVALFLIGMVQTHNNLKKINIEKIILFLSPSEGVGHGVFWVKSNNPEGHSQIGVQCKDSDDKIDVVIDTIYKNSLQPHYFEFQTGQWGRKKVSKFRVSTRYPFGFFYVWRYFQIPTEYFVYPTPSGEQKLSSVQNEGVNEGQNRQRKGDDFSEHKKYEPGESQKHIDWKAYARGRPLLTKKFDEGHRETVVLDYDMAKGNEERRMRQLSQWVHDCEDEKVAYALKIQDKIVPMSLGERHKASCLKLMAKHREAE